MSDKSKRIGTKVKCMMGLGGFAWLLIIDLSRVKALIGAFLSSMFYVNNWWLIFHQVSYFESFGPPSPEEMIDNDLQFYD